MVIANGSGRLLSLSSDLSKVREERAAFTGAHKSNELEYAEFVDQEAAIKGMLKGREDVLATLQQTGAGGLRGDLLCQIVRTGNNRRFELCLLQNRFEDALQSTNQSLRNLVSYELPRTGPVGLGTAQHDVHAASAKVYSLLEGQLTIYDLSGTIPKTMTGIGGGDAPISSFARLSNSMVVAVSANIARVYETTYGSVQAVVSLHIPGAASSHTKKRKRDSKDLEDMRTKSIAVAAFSELGTFVFLSGSLLVGVQLGEDVLTLSRAKNRPARLVDVLGRGTAAADLSGSKVDSEFTAHVDRLIDDGDLEGLETMVANDDSLGRQRKAEKVHWKERADGEKDGDATAYDDLWPLPEPLDPTRLNRERILYILGKVFSYAPDQPQIEVRVASRRLLEWLALAGHLNRQSLEKALQPFDADVQREPIHSGDIMTAISEIDEEFQLMHSLLSLPAQWELSEVIQALCLLIRSFDATPESGEQKGVPLAILGAPQLNGHTETTNGDVDMVNGDADSHVESESKAAETELEHVERILMSGLEVRSDTLRVILERLHAFPADDVTKLMRSMMTQKELIFLIHILRIELAEGGWTSRYVGAGADEDRYEGDRDPILASMVDVIPSDGETGPSNQAIRAIGDLLNCAVDAVGTSGWLVGLSGDALGTQELLDSLRAEVSAGLEGCYEANTLGTFVAELERFVASRPETKAKKGHQDEEEMDIVLPVGGRAESTAPSRKVKSKQALALEKSKRVGKYSLDRIRF